MYDQRELKRDLVANLRSGGPGKSALVDALEISEFEFVDSPKYSHREWNTFSRELKIYCRSIDKEIIDLNHDILYNLCDRLHRIKDEYMLVGLQVLIKASLDETANTDYEIIIVKKTTINKTDDYLGSGGFSVVYKKYDEQTDAEYAYKVFEPSPFQQSDFETMKKRFVREAKKLMSYSHDNIIRAFDFGFLGDKSAYIKIEYVKGKRLFDYIEHSVLGENEKDRLASQYVSAMAYIHEKSDIHRDISYSNVLISDNGNIKVLDFGFSKGQDDTNYDTIYADIVHKFDPPDTQYDIRTEVYCIGAILFTIYTGEQFHISKILRIDEISCSEFYKIAIKKCLENAPENRFQDAIELKNYLDVSVCDTNKHVDFHDLESRNVFSLDAFKMQIQKIRAIHFAQGELPSYSSIKEWIETQVAECLIEHKYIGKIDIVRLISRIKDVKKVTFYKNVDYEIDKDIINSLYCAYINFQQNEKTYVIKGICEIIRSKSVEDEFPFDL